MKIAIVSTDSVSVNEHFGKAERFLIYEVKPDGISFIESRQSVPLSVNDPNHSFDAQRFGKVFDAIKDCEKVFITQIGETPASKLKEQGIEPVVFDGLIKNIKL